jgi:hypothetical protein
MTPFWRAPFWLAAVIVWLGASCSRGEGSKHTRDDGPVPRAVTAEEETPAPRKGMVWIPGGVLIAGTPLDRVPRVADAEMPGEQVILHGFYIDEYPYPNEPGAIPKTGVDRDEATALCSVQGKRLCAELEWERACKGTGSTTYEYGDTYRATECATGAAGRPTPAGLHVGCKSGFGAHDMHGGAWEWTASQWGRRSAVPSESTLAVVRGGNGEPGELVGRCANAMPRSAKERAPNVGFRCCAGAPNEAEVNLRVDRGKLLERVSTKLAQGLLERASGDVAHAMPTGRPVDIDLAWLWHPIGNEELLIAGGCNGKEGHADCGVLVARMRYGSFQPIAFASSGRWLPTLRKDPDGHDVWVNGGDGRSTFGRRLAYLWGRVVVGEPERRRTPSADGGTEENEGEGQDTGR